MAWLLNSRRPRGSWLEEGSFSSLAQNCGCGSPSFSIWGQGKAQRTCGLDFFPLRGSDEGKYPFPSPILWLPNFFPHFRGLGRHDPLLPYPTPEKSPGILILFQAGWDHRSPGNAGPSCFSTGPPPPGHQRNVSAPGVLLGLGEN